MGSFSCRLDAFPHISPGDMYQLGLVYFREMKPVPYWQDLGHLKSGLMLDNLAYVKANDFTESPLTLEVFRPGSLTMPKNDQPIRDLKECSLVLAIYQTLLWRARLWDSSHETLLG